VSEERERRKRDRGRNGKERKETLLQDCDDTVLDRKRVNAVYRGRLLLDVLRSFLRCCRPAGSTGTARKETQRE
jgi:hypothetical protein